MTAAPAIDARARLLEGVEHPGTQGLCVLLIVVLRAESMDRARVAEDADAKKQRIDGQDPTWTPRAQRAFMAHLESHLGVPYHVLCAYLDSVFGLGKPSTWAYPGRVLLVELMQSQRLPGFRRRRDVVSGHDALRLAADLYMDRGLTKAAQNAASLRAAKRKQGATIAGGTT